jgi:hypothetical protein
MDDLEEAPDVGVSTPTRTSVVLDVLRERPGASVEDLALAAYPELATVEDPKEARKIRIRAVALLAKLVERGRLNRVSRGQYALPADRAVKT